MRDSASNTASELNDNDHHRRLLAAVFANASVALFVMDERQRCAYMNPAAENLTGYTIEETLGRPLHDVIHHTRPDGSHFPISECPIDRAFPERMRVQGDDVFVHKNGSFYPIAYTASPIRQDGLPIGTIIEVRAISDTERAERLLVGQKQAFEMAVAGAPVTEVLDHLVRVACEYAGDGRGAAIFVLDEENGYLRLGAASRMTPTYTERFTRVMIGPNSFSCATAAYTGTRVVVSDVVREPVWAPALDVAQDNAIRSCWSTPIRARGGKVLGTLDIYHATPREPAPGDLESIDLLAHTAALLIERSRAEEGLRHRTAQFETLLERAPLGVSLVDDAFRIRAVNPTARAALGGAEGLVGRNFDDVIHAVWVETDADEIVQLVRHTLQTGEAHIVPERAERRHDRVASEYYEWQVNRIRLPDGSDGVVCYFRDISTQVLARHAIAESEARYRHIVDGAREYAILTMDAERQITSWNSGAERLLGYRTEEILGRSADLFFIPEDRAAQAPALEMQGAIERGRSANERWHMRRNGSRFWGSGVMFSMEDGEQRGFLKMFRDRTEERRAEDRRMLLINELNHRVKNTLATVQSIAAQTLRAGCDPDIRRTFEDRLLALAEAHDLLTKENWGSAGLLDIARVALRPHLARNSTRVSIQGPNLRLAPNMAVSLCIAFHELATNAARHGALSADTGHVDLTWRIQGGRLLVRWREMGGPPVRPPSHRGFGTRMIERGLPRELDGEVHLSYTSEGVVCQITMPVPDIGGPEDDR